MVGEFFLGGDVGGQGGLFFVALADGTQNFAIIVLLSYQF